MNVAQIVMVSQLPSLSCYGENAQLPSAAILPCILRPLQNLTIFVTTMKRGEFLLEHKEMAHHSMNQHFKGLKN